MYDNLDDPTPPGADEQLRSEVLQRADQLRWRRRAIVLSSASVAVVAAVVSAVLLSGPPERSSLTVVSPTATPSETVTPSPTTTPTPTPAPTSASPTPRPAQTPTATSSPTSTGGVAHCQALGCPDGKPGWSTGYESCSPATVAPDGSGTPPVDGMQLTLALPSSVAAGTDAHGTLTITNRSSITVSFEVRQPRIGMEAGIAGSGGRSSTHASDALGSEAFQLDPGQSDSVNVVAHASSCGDGSGDPENALPPGSYQVGVTVGYVNAQRMDGASPSPSPGPDVRSHGSWSVAEPLRIT